MKILRNVSALLIACAVIISAVIMPVYASDDGSLEIKLKPGADTLVNGSIVKGEKPLMSGSVLLVPLKVVGEACGAELLWKGNGKITINFRDKTADIKYGSKSWTVNQETHNLSVAPRAVKNSTMVPVNLVVELFGLEQSYDSKTKTTSLVMEDDGALTDLSFLVDSIGKARIGNSYFGWSIKVPSGSRLDSVSFNSKYVSVENIPKGIYLEVNVKNEDKSLDELLESIEENPDEFSLDSTVLDFHMVDDATLPYIELYCTSFYDEAIVERVYKHNDNIVEVILYSMDILDPEMILEDALLKSIIDSFRFGYEGNQKDTQDTSKVSYGMVKYQNYESFTIEDKFLTWEMSIPPEWDNAEYINTNPASCKIGPNNKEYIDVVMDVKDSKSLTSYCEEIKKMYDKNTNPDLYSFISMGENKIGSTKTIQILYTLKVGKQTYIRDENYVEIGDYRYSWSIRCPESTYQAKKENFYNMLSTFKPVLKKTEEFNEKLSDYKFQINKNKVGKDSSLTEVENKNYKWKINVPGIWDKGYTSTYSNSQTLSDSFTGMGVFIQAVEKNQANLNLEDSAKFYMLSYLEEDENITFLGKKVLTEKNTSVTQYSYRMDDVDNEYFENVQCYVLYGEKYYYLVMISLPDISASASNVKVVADIWKSFEIID